MTAVTFLSRLPVGRFAGPNRLGESAYMFAVAGVIIAAVPAFVVWALSLLTLPHLLGATLVVAAGLLTTGALHEDGMADMADGFGGGATRERKIAIMRDSHIGAFGVLALIAVTAARIFALAALMGASAIAAIVALAAAASLSRAAMTGVMHVLPPARSDGRSSAAGQVSRVQAGLALASGGLIAGGLLFAWFHPAQIAVALILCGIAAAGTGWLSHRQIGGQTGDVLGAVQVTSELAILVALVAAF